MYGIFIFIQLTFINIYLCNAYNVLKSLCSVELKTTTEHWCLGRGQLVMPMLFSMGFAYTFIDNDV